MYIFESFHYCCQSSREISLYCFTFLHCAFFLGRAHCCNRCKVNCFIMQDSLIGQQTLGFFQKPHSWSYDHLRGSSMLATASPFPCVTCSTSFAVLVFCLVSYIICHVSHVCELPKYTKLQQLKAKIFIYGQLLIKS